MKIWKFIKNNPEKSLNEANDINQTQQETNSDLTHQLENNESNMSDVKSEDEPQQEINKPPTNRRRNSKRDNLRPITRIRE